MKYKLLTLVSNIFLLFFSIATHAATVVQSQTVQMSSFHSSSNDLGGSLYNFGLGDSQSLNFQRFDSNLGNLLSIDFTLTVTNQFDVRAGFSESAGFFLVEDVNGSVTLNQRLITYSAAGLFGSLNFSSPNDSCNATGTTGAYCIAQAAGSNSNVTDSTSVAIANITDYVGAGTVSMSLVQGGIFQVVNLDAGDSVIDFRTGSNSFNGTAQLTYTYSPVPLPAASWLFLTAIGALFYKKQRSS